MVLLGRNCSQGKLKLIYMMMLLQAAMIVKSLPKYMYMYYPALSSSICLPIKMLRNGNHQGQRNVRQLLVSHG